MPNFVTVKSAFADLLAYQTRLQLILRDKIQSMPSPMNISQGWYPIHFGVNMLDNVIEECIEAKRLIKARKWWTPSERIIENAEALNTPGPTREELVEELCDIQIQFLNALVYFSVSPEEFAKALLAKMEKNNPDNAHSDLGQRS